MIFLKTKGDTFLNIWEKNGIAPFNSNYAGKEIYSLSDKCPLLALGFYSGSQSAKSVSLLKITQIKEKEGSLNDIQILFDFLQKIDDINSNDFDNEVSQYGNKLLIISSDSEAEKILKKFGYKLKPRKEQQEVILPPTVYNQNYLSDFFYNFYNWQEFEKKSSMLFNMLGFQIIFEGHKKEKKRVPDFYCYSPPIIKNERYCIIVDCKYQEEYFINATDERAMKEYILEKKVIITQEGIPSDQLYFIFVAKSFSKNAKIKLLELSQETKAFGALFSINNLRFLVEKKMRMGYKFYLEILPKLLKNQEISPSHINYHYKIDEEYSV